MQGRILPFLCLPLILSVAPAQAETPAGSIKMINNIVYGKGGNQELKLDLAMPVQPKGTFPALVCIHGGGWVRGSRQQMHSTVQALAQRGYVAVTIDYRLAPASRFPAQIEDCKAAVRWLRANAKKYQIDPNRIGALGFSAGAHLASLLGLTAKTNGFEGKGGNPEQSSKVQAVVSFFGPYDLTWKEWGKTVKKDNILPLLGPLSDLYAAASPLLHIHKGAPPFLFFHGTEDPIVPIGQAKEMAKRLHAVGSSATLIPLEKEGHGWKGEKLVATLKQMMQFFDMTLKK